MNRSRLSALAVALGLSLGLSACGGDTEVQPAGGALVSEQPAGAASEPAPPAPNAAEPGEDDRDDEVVDPQLRAELERVALERLGAGQVSEVELSDDGDHRYEVEVDDVNGDDDVVVEIDEDLTVVRVDR